MVPTEIFVFVGYRYNIRSGLIFVPPERVSNLLGLLQGVIDSRSITARTLMCVLGLLAPMEKLVNLGRLHMHPIQWHVKDHWTHTKHRDHVIPVTTALCQALKWWLAKDNLTRPSQNTPSGSLFRHFPHGVGFFLRSLDGAGHMETSVDRQIYK